MIKLNHFLQDFSLITVASQEDNQEILLFFHSLEMNNKDSSISYDRAPDFFEYLRLCSSQYYVFLLKNESGNIKGVGTLIIKDSYVDGKVQEVCYLGDLRVSTLKMTVYWRKFYSQLIANMKMIEEFSNTKLNYTAILDENLIAQKALIHGKNSYKYDVINKYSMINILAPSLFFKSRANCQRTLLNEDLKIFISSSQTLNTFGITRSELDYREKNWDNYKNNFITITNKQGAIIAATSLWSPFSSKKIKVSNFSKLTQYFYRFSKLGFISPSLRSPLRPLYLTTLTFHPELNKPERIDALKGILKFSFSSDIYKDYHFLTLTDVESDSLSKAYRSCYYHKTSATLYSVRDNSEEPYVFNTRNESLFIEIALI